ncbi:MAG: hypothetical protein AAGK02_01120 [Pseudomonadota bacterium]
MEIRRFVVNADPTWLFHQYVRTFSLDLYRAEAGVALWDISRDDPPQDDRGFWGDWPISPGADVSPLEEELESVISRLKATRSRRAVLIFVLSLADLKRMADDGNGLSPAGQRALRLLKGIYEILDRDAGRDNVADLASGLWISLAIRDGGDEPENRRLADNACRKFVSPFRNGAVHTCFFLSTSAANELSEAALEVHFHKLRMLVDITGQTDVGRDRSADMWTQLRLRRRDGTPYVARLALDRPYEDYSWTTSDVLRSALLEWRDDQLDSAARIDEQANELQESVKSLLKGVELQVDVADINDVLERDFGYDFKRARTDAGDEDLKLEAWPDFGWFLKFREDRIETLETQFQAFTRALGRLYESYLDKVPDFIEMERRRHRDERDRINRSLAQLESGLADSVRETANRCLVDVERERRHLASEASKIRSAVHEKFVPRAKGAVGHYDERTSVSDLARYSDLNAAHEATVESARRLSRLRYCVTAVALCSIPFLIVALVASLVGSSTGILDAILDNWGHRLFFVIMLTTGLLTFFVMTRSYTKRFHRSYNELKKQAQEALDAVDDIPAYAYRYGSKLGRSGLLTPIGAQLRDLASTSGADQFERGFQNMTVVRPADRNSMPEAANTLRHRIDQDYASSLRTGKPYERVRNLLSSIELEGMVGAFDLIITENRGGDPIRVDSSHIFSDAARLEPL